MPVVHQPTYESTGRSWWASCSCGGWRSGLSASKQEIKAQYAQHLEDA